MTLGLESMRRPYIPSKDQKGIELFETRDLRTRTNKNPCCWDIAYYSAFQDYSNNFAKISRVNWSITFAK